MRVLVSVASRHGASFEIAEEISATLAAAGFQTAVLPPDAVTTLDDYDAVILGSSVYVGHWMDAAVHLVERFSKEIRERPVWLFSSGPIGHEPRADDEPVDVADVVAATGAREHKVFAGQVDRSRLGLGEKVILTAVRAPEGDFRPWDEIHAWANEIAAALRQG
ncbi:MAG: flavodoxin [Chloroflexi bacterium]|nr:flavodoxin [Chloroflexota bacterium]